MSSISRFGKSTRVLIRSLKSYSSVLPKGFLRFLNTHCLKKVLASLNSTGILESLPPNNWRLNSSNFCSIYGTVAFIYLLNYNFLNPFFMLSLSPKFRLFVHHHAQEFPKFAILSSLSEWCVVTPLPFVQSFVKSKYCRLQS